MYWHSEIDPSGRIKQGWNVEPRNLVRYKALEDRGESGIGWDQQERFVDEGERGYRRCKMEVEVEAEVEQGKRVDAEIYHCLLMECLLLMQWT